MRELIVIYNTAYIHDFIPLRSVFPNETSDFTPWIINTNIIPLILEKINSLFSNYSLWRKEVTIKKYRIDAIYKDNNNAKKPFIIIENQFGLSDNKHLGQIITYLNQTKSHYALWICEEISEEHLGISSSLNDLYIFQATISMTKNHTFYIKIFDGSGKMLDTLFYQPTSEEIICLN